MTDERQSTRALADRFEQLLIEYSDKDAEVKALYESVMPLIRSSQQGTISFPVDWHEIPGSRSFIEGGLRRYGDLESAYAHFKLALMREL